MKKDVIADFSQAINHDAIPDANEGESLEEFTRRAYPEFDSFIEDRQENPVYEDLKKSIIYEDFESDSAIRNAVARLFVRTRIVEKWCQVNKPFEVQEPESKSDEDLVAEHIAGGIDAVSILKENMGEEQFAAYAKGFRQPKSKGKSATQVRLERLEHYAKNGGDVWPSKKTAEHNGNQSETYYFHWDANIQSQYPEDHKRFLESLGLEDATYQPKPEEPENGESDDSEE